MALHGNMLLAPAGGYSGYSIDNSMVFDSSSTQYLSRTPSSAGNRKTWTFSCWIKRNEFGNPGGDRVIFGADAGSGNFLHIRFTGSVAPSDRLSIQSSGTLDLKYSRLLRDPGSFFHLCIAFDTTESTDSDRVKVWINGVLQTDRDTTTWPTLNADYPMNNNIAHHFGRLNYAGSNHFDDCLSEVHFVDGTAYSATDFGEFFNGTTAWRAISPSGLTYGTNGFYLPFTQDTPNLGTDYSGNGNDWTENGSPVQSGDSPTNNYATLNALTPGGSLGLSDGNLKTSRTLANSHNLIKSTVPLAGKCYFECYPTLTNYTAFYIGFATASAQTVDSSGTLGDNDLTSSGRYGYYGGLNQYNGTTASSISAPASSSDYICWAIDVDEGDAWLGKHSGGAITWEGGGDPVAGTSPTFTFTETEEIFACVAGSDAPVINFGATGWGTTIPSGFDGVYAANLPAVTIENPEEHFQTLLHTGTGAEQAVTGCGFQPDFTWIKNRDAADSHMLFDVIRGATEVLHADTAAIEATEAQTLKSFDSDGFTLGTDVQVNTNTEDYVSWNWKAGGSGSVDTTGTISATVSANADAGFSIFTYSGNSTSGATVAHGLGQVPEMFFIKARTFAEATQVYHASQGATHRGELSSSAAFAALSNRWNNTDPTSTLITLGNHNSVNTSYDYVGFAFASIPGYSKVFSYTGNGSADGPFVYCGFKPRFVLSKGSENWVVWDSERDTYNVRNKVLYPNLSVIENNSGVLDYIDFLSGGFKIRGTDTRINQSSITFIGIAFAENPFGGSNLPLGLAQ